MITLIIATCFLAGFSASFSFFLDFCFGLPKSGKPYTQAIFFKYSLYLAKRRLKKHDSEFLNLNINYPENLVIRGRDFFTWENAAGMCAVCTNFWLSLVIFATIYAAFFHPLSYFHGAQNVIFTLMLFLSNILLSHTILRKFFLV